MKPASTGPAVLFSLSLLVGCAEAALEADELDESLGTDGKSDELGGPAALTARGPLPIVLLHGMAGFDRIGLLDYYFGVAWNLEDEGHEVFTTVVDPLQLIDVRAEQLAGQIDAILEETGADRVHLIGHSQGGLDARFLISSLGYGDRVATLTTISTPHRGSRVADVALEILPGGAEDALGFFINFFVGGVVGSEQDIIGQVYQLTEEYAVNTFGPANPDDPRVAYYSVAGVTQTNPFANPWRNDLCDPLLLAPYYLLRPYGASDGVVSTASATRGTLLGTVPADHLDEVGQILGTTALGFNHRSFYRKLARYLTDPAAPSPL